MRGLRMVRSGIFSYPANMRSAVEGRTRRAPGPPYCGVRRPVAPTAQRNLGHRPHHRFAHLNDVDPVDRSPYDPAFLVDLAGNPLAFSKVRMSTDRDVRHKRKIA